MSVQAMTWVLDDAPDLPAHLVGTLMGLANHASRDGSGARPSQETLAGYARKSDRAIRKDLTQLEALGLIRRGDQRLVEHLPADRRPVVWDLAVERKQAAETSNDRNHSSARGAEATGTTGGPTAGTTVPPVDPPRAEPQFRSRPELQGKTTGTGVPTNQVRTKTSSSPSISARSRIASAIGAEEDDERVTRVLDHIRATHAPTSLSPWVRSLPAEDLDAIVAAALAVRPVVAVPSVSRVAAHPFVADGSGVTCAQPGCGLRAPNKAHRVGLSVVADDAA